MAAALHGVTKRFGGQAVLRDVTLSVSDGQIHALLGANGSGKSTLVRVITGVYEPDGGRILIGDDDVTHEWTPALATAAGVRVVHQEAPLVDQLSVAESIALFSGYPRGAAGRIVWKDLHRATQRMLDYSAIPRRSADLTRRLTGAERAMLALELAVRSASGQLRLLVLDEATAALPDTEAEPFLRHVRRIADSGVPVLMVTHRLAELAAADRVTVLDAGSVALQGSARETSREDIVQIMRRGTAQHAAAAATTAQSAPSRVEPEQGSVAMIVRNLQGRDLRGIDLVLRQGEIVGVMGRRGGGLEELPRLLTGAETRSGGDISVDGVELPRSLTPRVALRHGIMHLPADRLHEGGVATLSVTENVVLPDARRFWHRRKDERRAVASVIENLHVWPKNPNTLFGRLSGGNQQKVILGRLLRFSPRILVLADPTYGVDPAAREVMFHAIRSASVEGVAVLMTSTEPEQMVGLCDRVLVLEGGRISDEISGAETTVEEMLARAF